LNKGENQITIPKNPPPPSSNQTQITDYNIFNGIASSPTLKNVLLKLPKISEIPDNAFKSEPWAASILESIDFGKTKTLTRIGKNAFSGLKLAESGSYRHLWINLDDQMISKIDEGAFAFPGPNQTQTTGDNLIMISLENNQLTAESFGKGSFATKWKLDLNLGGNNITYLPEATFGEYLSSSPKLQINLEKNPFNCFDCRNKWLVKYNPNNRPHIYVNCKGPIYKDFKELTEDDFKNCKSTGKTSKKAGKKALSG
jgi:hypothetical protein